MNNEKKVAGLYIRVSTHTGVSNFLSIFINFTYILHNILKKYLKVL